MTEGSGFTVGCFDCKAKTREGLGPLFATDREDFVGSVLASNAAQFHETMHPTHHIVIFSFQRKQ